MSNLTKGTSNEPNLPESRHAGDNNKRIDRLGWIALVYAIVVGILLAGLWMATFTYETAPLARVFGLGCYGIAAVGAMLHIVVGFGLRRKTRWVDSLVRGTTTAIVIPLILVPTLFLVLSLQADLNHVFWSIVAAVIAVPWPLYLQSVMKRLD